jgi:hypothetical protein
LSKPFKIAQGAIQSSVNAIISTVQGLLAPVQGVVSGLSTTFSGFIADFTTGFLLPLSINLGTLVGEGGLLGQGGLFSTALTGLFGEGGTLPSLLSNASALFQTLTSDITNAITEAGNQFVGFQVLLDLVRLGIESTITGIKNIFTAWAGDVGLGQVAATLKMQLVDAFIAAVNSVISAFNNALGGITGSVRSLASFLGIDLGDLQIAPITANARGALGFKGLSLVGEEGPELVNFKRPANIFPAGLTRSIMDTLAAPEGMVLQGGANGDTIYNNQTTNNSSTFNVGNPTAARLLERQRQLYLGAG